MQLKKEIHLSIPEIAKLSYCFCGYHDCPSGYAYGPTVRDEYILHYVNRGTGFYRINKSSFRVCRGSSFILFPGYILHYQADKTDPWEYYWVAFDGRDVQQVLAKCGIRPADPIIEHRNPDKMQTFFRQILSCATKQNLHGDFETMTLFYRIMACITRDLAARNQAAGDTGVLENYNEHIQKAVAYIQENYFDHDMSVDTIANRVYLERSYFSTIFKDHIGMSPHHFLIKIRMENACRMLSDSSMAIKKVAYSVGYREQGYFDKVFRRSMGLSPSEYRESVRKTLGLSDGGKDIPEQLDRSFFS